MSRFALQLRGRRGRVRSIDSAHRGRWRPASQRGVLRAATTFFAGGLVAMVAAGPVQAAPYRAFACKTPDGRPLALGPEWTFNHSTTWAGWADACPSGGPVTLTQGFSNSTSALGQGTGAWLQFSVPSGLSLGGVVARRTVSTAHDPRDVDATAEWALEMRDGLNTNLRDQCKASVGCQRGDIGAGDGPANDVQWPGISGLSEVFFRVRCKGEPHGTCMYSGGPRVSFQMHRVELLLDDSRVPTTSGATTGTALSSETPVRGEASVLTRVGDYGSGLYLLAVDVDGRKVAQWHDSNGGRCENTNTRPVPSYTAVVPCRTGIYDHKLVFDSSRFEDGQHNVSVYAVDAAGNRTAVAEKTVVFDNFFSPKNTERPKLSAPSERVRPGDVLKTTSGEWEGRNVSLAYRWERSSDGANWGEIPKATSPTYVVDRDDLGQYLRAVVVASNTDGPPTEVPTERTAKVESGATVVPAGLGEMSEPQPQPTPSSEAPDSPAQLVVDREQRTVDVKHGAKIVLTGRLVDADGQPIPNAVVDVFEQLVLTAAPWNKIDSVVTDSQGGYSYRPRTTASRRLRFAFADKRDAAKYRATREVLVSVQGAMSISAQRKVLSPGQTIRLRGRLTVDQLPKTGTWVEVQVLDAGVWRTIATRKTSSKGLWTFKHRLRQSRGITFRFRSRLRPVGDVASAETKSQTLKVRVR